MTDDDIAAELIGVFEQVFGRSMPELCRDTTPSQVDGWNSLRHAELIMSIEEHFGIEYPEDKYLDFETLGDIADIVAALCPGRPADRRRSSLAPSRCDAVQIEGGVRFHQAGMDRRLARADHPMGASAAPLSPLPRDAL